MQEKDVVSIDYLSEPERLADLVNGYVCQGEGIFQPNDIHKVERSVARIGRQSGEIYAQVITADVVCRLVKGMHIALIMLENQTDIHYAMPIRVMNLESASYHKQWRKAAKRHKKNKDLQGAEYLSGFAKGEQLLPAIIIVLYFGKKPWDGPKNVRDMLNVKSLPESMQKMIVDYPIHLLEVREYKEIEQFRSDLQYVFGFLQKEKDKEGLATYVKEHKDVFANLQEDAYDMISVMSHSEQLQEIKRQEDKGGKYNMCQAIDEMIEDGRMEGRIEGKAEVLLELLDDLGSVPVEVKQNIMGQKDIIILSNWIKVAARVDSVEEFMQKIQMNEVI